MKTIFEVSKSGLYSAERALSVTANNVINADTPGYSRQRLETAPVGQHMHGYHAGLGVNVAGITRLRNELADIQLNDKRQQMGYMQEKEKILEQLESSLATDSGGDLDVQLGRLFDTFSELSNDPQDLSVRNNLVGEARQLTEKLGDLSRNLDRVSDITRDSITSNIRQINDLLQDLASLNKSITTAQAMGQPDHTSLDLQVKKLEDLSNLVNIDTSVVENGSLQIHIGGVQVLHEDTYRKLVPDNDDVLKTYGVHLENGTEIKPSGGGLAAGIEMYESEVPGMKGRLDQIAETMVNEVNALHASGYGLEDNVHRDFFDPAGVTAATMRLNEEIVHNHKHIAASSVEFEAGNGQIAADMAELRNRQLIEGRKMIDYAVDTISSAGSDLSRLRNTMETRESEIRMLEVQQEREAGVNIDEELSLMIQYQNAYQGAARVMASAQQMMDTLISLVR
ncbi:flagellar hook-associated protein FlgK [Balneolales bacterium ANBcel1]|nr:flagellar hook-associated protein FlgK [Balneolales bacterium ANBcel1]